MIGVVNKHTNESHEFGNGFVALKKLSEFMKYKNKDDYQIFLGRFESERNEILKDM